MLEVMVREGGKRGFVVMDLDVRVWKGCAWEVHGEAGDGDGDGWRG